MDSERYKLKGHEYWVTGCAVTPDGTRIVSVGLNIIKVWRLSDGRNELSISLPGNVMCVSLHPWKPIMACGGGFHILELVGLEYESIIVTVTERMQRLDLLCPSCQTHHPINPSQLGTVLTCPTEGCGLRLKINPFVIQMT
jgi:WD40 repeat protein